VQHGRARLGVGGGCPLQRTRGRLGGSPLLVGIDRRALGLSPPVRLGRMCRRSSRNRVLLTGKAGLR
jgi:hypothetical protein